MAAAQALVPVQLHGHNDGMLVVRGPDLRRFLMSLQKSGKQLDAVSLQRCFVKTDAVY